MQRCVANSCCHLSAYYVPGTVLLRAVSKKKQTQPQITAYHFNECFPMYFNVLTHPEKIKYYSRLDHFLIFNGTST